MCLSVLTAAAPGTRLRPIPITRGSDPHALAPAAFRHIVHPAVQRVYRAQPKEVDSRRPIEPLVVAGFKTALYESMAYAVWCRTRERHVGLAVPVATSATFAQ